MKIIFFVVFLFMSSTLYAAHLECVMPIKRIFTGYTPSTSKIHVDHGPGYTDSFVRMPYVNNDEQIVDRILSVLMAAQLSGRSVRFRFIEGVNGEPPSCNPNVNQAFSAVWIE